VSDLTMGLERAHWADLGALEKRLYELEGIVEDNQDAFVRLLDRVDGLEKQVSGDREDADRYRRAAKALSEI